MNEFIYWVKESYTINIVYKFIYKPLFTIPTNKSLYISYVQSRFKKQYIKNGLY